MQVTRLSGGRQARPAVPRRVGPLGPHARRVCGGRGGAERRRLDPIRLNSAVVQRCRVRSTKFCSHFGHKLSARRRSLIAWRFVLAS
jgi:hypothetical protein